MAAWDPRTFKSEGGYEAGGKVRKRKVSTTKPKSNRANINKTNNITATQNRILTKELLLSYI